jgi:hypothetical protein
VRSRRLAVRLVGLASIAVLLAGTAARSEAAPGLIVGVTDNAFRWQSLVATATARDLGLTAFRVSLEWSPGLTDLTAGDAANLDAMVSAAAGLRIVLTVTGAPQSAPLTGLARDAYCGYVRSVLARYPTINDVVIWNEPNPVFSGSRSSARAVPVSLRRRMRLCSPAVGMSCTASGPM